MTEGELDKLIIQAVSDLSGTVTGVIDGRVNFAFFQTYTEKVLHQIATSASKSPLGKSDSSLEDLTRKVFGASNDPSDLDNLGIAMEALLIAHERNQRYKDSWKQAGWRGAVFDIRKKAERLFRQYFAPEVPDADGEDDAYDLINFAIFFLRARRDKNEWGMWL